MPSRTAAMICSSVQLPMPGPLSGVMFGDAPHADRLGHLEAAGADVREVRALGPIAVWQTEARAGLRDGTRRARRASDRVRGWLRPASAFDGLHRLPGGSRRGRLFLFLLAARERRERRTHDQRFFIVRRIVTQGRVGDSFSARDLSPTSRAENSAPVRRGSVAVTWAAADRRAASPIEPQDKLDRAIALSRRDRRRANSTAVRELERARDASARARNACPVHCRSDAASVRLHSSHRPGRDGHPSRSSGASVPRVRPRRIS